MRNKILQMMFNTILSNPSYLNHNQGHNSETRSHTDIASSSGSKGNEAQKLQKRIKKNTVSKYGT